jgi:hypothetical protein
VRSLNNAIAAYKTAASLSETRARLSSVKHNLSGTETCQNQPYHSLKILLTK